jgi:hypothetical protein
MHSVRHAVVVLTLFSGFAGRPELLNAQPPPTLRGELSALWSPPANGAMPRDVLVLRSGGGPPEFVCQTSISGELAIGIASDGVCRVGTAGNRVETREFNVLSLNQRPGARLAAAIADSLAGEANGGAVAGAGRGARGAAGDTTAQGVIQPTTPEECTNELLAHPELGATEVRPGIEANGRPFVDAVFADGTVRHVTRSGVTVNLPDGTSIECGRRFAAMGAQAPTPPALPEDPTQGRRWMQSHSDAVLAVIRSMTSDEVVAALEAAAPQTARDDVFEQIAYRTGIAAFYAERLP